MNNGRERRKRESPSPWLIGTPFDAFDAAPEGWIGLVFLGIVLVAMLVAYLMRSAPTERESGKR